MKFMTTRARSRISLLIMKEIPSGDVTRPTFLYVLQPEFILLRTTAYSKRNLMVLTFTNKKSVEIAEQSTAHNICKLLGQRPFPR